MPTCLAIFYLLVLEENVCVSAIVCRLHRIEIARQRNKPYLLKPKRSGSVKMLADVRAVCSHHPARLLIGGVLLVGRADHAECIAALLTNALFGSVSFVTIPNANTLLTGIAVESDV